MANLDVIRSVLPCFKDKRLVVVGDAILDEYIVGSAQRISPEAPVPVVNVQKQYYMMGGAGNVAHNVLALGAQCDLFSLVGADFAGHQLRDLGRAGTLGGRWIVSTEWTTPWKTRVVARGQQIVRLDHEAVNKLTRPSTRQLLNAVESKLPCASGLILSDYGKGLMTPKLVHRLMAEAAHFNVPVFVDPKEHARVYDGAWLIKPNAQEALVSSGLKMQTLHHAGQGIRAQAGGADVIITQGEKGMLVFNCPGLPTRIPTVPQQVRDVQGAGDTAMAALALARVSGATLMESAVIANAAAGVVVGKPGTATATREEVSQALAGVLEAQEGETDAA